MPRPDPAGRALAALSRAGLALSMVLLALMAALIVLQILARNVQDMGLPWADELARFCGIGLVFMALPCLAGRGGLVSVTLLPDMLGGGARRVMTLISDLSTLAFAAVLLWSFAAFLPRAGKFLTPAIGMPNWLYYAFALCGTLLLTLVAALRVVEGLRGVPPGAAHGGDVPT